MLVLVQPSSDSDANRARGSDAAAEGGEGVVELVELQAEAEAEVEEEEASEDVEEATSMSQLAGGGKERRPDVHKDGRRALCEPTPEPPVRHARIECLASVTVDVAS
jgi:hypothetical protein